MKKNSICIFLCNAKIVECENEDFRFEENLSIPCYKIKKIALLQYKTVFYRKNLFIYIFSFGLYII